MKNMLMVLAVIGLLVASGAAWAQDLSEIKTQLDNGNTKSSLRKLDDVLLKALSMKVDALTRLQKPAQALEAYELLVSIKKKEVMPLWGKVSWSLLLSVLSSKNGKAHELAAEYLGELGDKKAVAPLIPLLRSRSMLVQIKVAEALGKLGDSTASPALQRLLKVRNPLVSSSAAWALGKLGVSAGVSFLTTCFKRKGRRYRAIRLRCAQFLGRLGKGNTKSYLRRQMKTNSNRRARQGIAESLSALRDSSWTRSMISDLRSRTEATRIIAAQTLGTLKIRKSRRALTRLLRDRSLRVKIAAAHALNRLGSKSGIKTLLSALTSSDALMRADAAAALIDAPRGAGSLSGPLTSALKDKHLLVRVHAGFALVRLRSQVGTGVIREAFARGNLPLKMLAIKYAIETTRKHASLSGQPLERKFGQLRLAKITKAFDEGSGGEPDTDPSDLDGPSEPTKTARGRKAPTRRKVRRRPPPPRKGKNPDAVDDDW